MVRTPAPDIGSRPGGATHRKDENEANRAMVVGPSWPPWPNCLGMLSGAGHKMGKAIRVAGSILVDIGPTPGPAVGTEGPPGTTYLYQSVAGTLTL